MIAALTITGCNINHADNDSTSKDPATTSETSQNSDGSEQSSSEGPKEEVKNNNFTLLNPTNLFFTTYQKYEKATKHIFKMKNNTKYQWTKEH